MIFLAHAIEPFVTQQRLDCNWRDLMPVGRGILVMYQKRNTLLATAAMVLPVLMASPSHAAPITVTATILADNGSLAVLEQTPGNFAVINNSVSGQWPTPKTFTFQIDNDAQAMRECKVHVIAWGDGSVAQGMMAHFGGDGGSVYTGQAGGPFTVAMSSITHSGGTAAGQAFANNNANAASIITNLGAAGNGFVSQAVVTGGIPGTWGPVNLPDVQGRGDIKFLWNTSSNALNANPNNYRVISTPCNRVVRPAQPPKPMDHIPSWEIAGQFNANQNPFEVWSYGYKQAADCTGPLVLTTNPVTQSWTRNVLYWLRGTNINNSSDLPAIGQSQGATLLTPLRFSPKGLTMHPGPQNQCAVVRFTVPERGRYRMMGRFWAQNVSAPGNETDTDTMVVHTNASGTPSFIDPVTRVQALSGPVTNNHFEIIGNGQMFDQGDTIDFMVGSRGNFNSDSTGLHGYIERVTP